MRIYYLTPLGQRYAQSTSSQDTPGWRIIHQLRHLGKATPDQLARFVGVDEGQVAAFMGQLKRKGLVKELGSEQGGGFSGKYKI